MSKKGGVAFITGGNRGIGAATAQALTDAGHRVVIGSRSGQASEIPGVPSVAVDVGDGESIEKAITKVEETYGPISILIANAGITRDSLLMRMEDQDIEETIATNLVG